MSAIDGCGMADGMEKSLCHPERNWILVGSTVRPETNYMYLCPHNTASLNMF